jgi:hypothetical protein
MIRNKIRFRFNQCRPCAPRDAMHKPTAGSGPGCRVSHRPTTLSVIAFRHYQLLIFWSSLDPAQLCVRIVRPSHPSISLPMSVHPSMQSTTRIKNSGPKSQPKSVDHLIRTCQRLRNPSEQGNPHILTRPTRIWSSTQSRSPGVFLSHSRQGRKWRQPIDNWPSPSI